MHAQPSNRPNAAGPSFLAALAAVLAAGAAASVGTYLAFGLILGHPESLVVSAVAGGFLVRWLLGVMGSEITARAGVLALLAGAGASYLVTHFLLHAGSGVPLVLPTSGLEGALPSLLLSAWLVKQASTRARG
jgi:hypothetical protein